MNIKVDLSLADTLLSQYQDFSTSGSASHGAIRSIPVGPFASAQSQVFDAGSGDGGSEVVAQFDGKLYVTNGEDDKIDIFDIASGALIDEIDLTTIPDYDGVNSVAASAAGIAVAIESPDGAIGKVALFDIANPAAAPTLFDAGSLPDMVTFSKDGNFIFVANEGEATDDSDPAGSISVINLLTDQVETFGFETFDSQVEALEAEGVRLFPGKLPSEDFEPEYIAEGADGKLYVSLQEANAIAVFDLATMSWDKIFSCGVVDHSIEGFGIDPSDKDDAINIHTVPVYGMRMPDAIATAEIAGQTYILTANEGDARNEDDRIKDLELDETAFPDADALQEDEELGRLNVSTIDGDTDGDGKYEELYAYGSRSFTIFDTDGTVIFDSGDDFEQIIAANRPANAFNNDDFPSDDSDVVDENRSDNKGPEPEAITVGQVDGRTLAFIGLERDSGIMIYDITRPGDAYFVDYIDGSENGHISPEVITFISADDSLTGTAQIAASYEVSGTTATYELAYGRVIVGTHGANLLEGTLGADVIAARAGADYVDAGGSDDRVVGGAGTDILLGGAGNDIVIGGADADTIAGGSGDDTLIGGQGHDVFVFTQGSGRDVIADLRFGDKIDMSATGLGFDDLNIGQYDSTTFTVNYGDPEDFLVVVMKGANAVLDEGDFLF